ncbi:MAG: Ig-like domain repeat protein, partial [Acidobacteriaceae bacterium]|nr:Ig-like domain repeat protein [Acidobacteriaceae bacterium]
MRNTPGYGVPGPGAATSIRLGNYNANIHGLVADRYGNVYFADYGSCVVRKIDATGWMTIIAGTPKTTGTCAGATSITTPKDATTTAIGLAQQLGLDPKRNVLYIGDATNNVIDKLDLSTGLIVQFAGKFGTAASSANAQTDNVDATTSPLNIDYRSGMAVDGQGNIFISSAVNNVIQEITISDMRLHKIAGTGGTNGSGNVGQNNVGISPAYNAQLNTPEGIAFDPWGNLWIGVSYAFYVAKITNPGPTATCGVGSAPMACGQIVVAAGSLSSGAGAYTPATMDGKPAPNPPGPTRLSYTNYAAFDATSGSMFISDWDHYRVEQVKNGIIWSAVGEGSNTDTSMTRCTGQLDAIANGCPATLATLGQVGAVAADNVGSLYVYSGSYNQVIQRVSLIPQPMLRVNLGQSSTNNTRIWFNFATNGSYTTQKLGAPRALTLGNPNSTANATPTQDFAVASNSSYASVNGSCSTVPTYATTNNCYVDVSFTPHTPGMSMGAVELVDPSGNILATAYVYGTGVGPQVVYNTPLDAPKVVSTGFTGPFDVTKDGKGNIFVADGSNGVQSISCDSVSCTNNPVPTGTTPQRVLVDGLGNLIVDDPAIGVSLIPVSSTGTYSASNAIVVAPVNGNLGNGVVLITPQAEGVDGTGTIYVLDSTTGTVTQVPVGCTISTDPSVTPCAFQIGAGSLNNPQALAVGSTADIYVADTGNGAIQLIQAGCTDSSCVSTMVTGLSSPTGVAVDPAGNIYVADSGNGSVLEFPSVDPSTGQPCKDTSCAITLGTGYVTPSNLMLDRNGSIYGDLYVTDTGSHTLYKLSRTSPPPMTFPVTQMGNSSFSSSDPTYAQLQNIGNDTLVFSSTTANPSFTTDAYVIDGSSTCPQITAGGSTGTLNAGSTCTIVPKFQPQLPNSYPDNIKVSGQSLSGYDITSSIPLVPLSGKSANVTFTPTGVPSATYGETYAAASPLVSFAPKGSPTPGATYTFSCDAPCGLPAGLTLNSDGSITGTAEPYGTGVYNFSVTATDSTLSTDGGPYWGTQNYTLFISPATVTPTITANNKSYDGTNAATLSTCSIVPVVPGDAGNIGCTVDTTPGSGAYFASNGPGPGITVFVPGAAVTSLTGSAMNAYKLAPGPYITKADITANTITVACTALGKVYDGTPTEPASAVTCTLSGLAASDTTTSYMVINAAFDSADVSPSRTVTANVMITDSTAYQFANGTLMTTVTATTTPTLTPIAITPATLTPTVRVVRAKTYDGISPATATISSCYFAGGTSGVVAADQGNSSALACNFTSATATFDNPNSAEPGMNKPVSVTGLTLTGTSAGNYTFAGTATTTGDITVDLKANITYLGRAYDGTTTIPTSAVSCTLTPTTPVTPAPALSGITCAVTSAAYSSANVNPTQPQAIKGVVKISDTSGGAYTISNTPDTTGAPNYVVYGSAPMTAAPATVTIASTKTYDGTTAVLAASCAATGAVGADVLGCTVNTPPNFTFSSANAGPESFTGATAASVSLTGTQPGNYTVTVSPASSGTINRAPLTVTAKDQAMPYGGPLPSAASLADQYTINGLVNGEREADVLTGAAAVTIDPAITNGTLPNTYAGAVWISQGNLAANPLNYSFTFVPGNLTVIQSTTGVSITPQSAAVTYGTTSTSFSAQITPVGTGTMTFTATRVLSDGTLDTPNAINLGSPSVDATGKATVNVGATPNVLPAGNYRIVATFNGIPSGVSDAATLLVNPAPLTLTAPSGTRTTTGSDPACIVANALGFVNGDTVTTAVTGTPVCTTDAGSTPGAFNNYLSGLSASNYTITYQPGTITVALSDLSSLTLSVPPSPWTYGDPETLTVNLVSSGSPAPTGSVSFYYYDTSIGSSTLLGMANVSGGSASLLLDGTNTPFVPAGSHTVYAVYNGDVTYASKQSNLAPVTVVKNPVNTLTVTVFNVSRVYGASNPQFSYQVTGTVNPGDSLITAVSGVAQFITADKTTGNPDSSTSPAGSSFWINVVDDSNQPCQDTSSTNPSTTCSLQSANYYLHFVYGTLSITSTTSTTTLTANGNATPNATQVALTYGDTLTLVATVPSDASGQVLFLNGANYLGQATVSGGTATLTLDGTTGSGHGPLLPVGAYSITAQYVGDTNYGYSVSAAANVTVARQTTPLVLKANDASRLYGQGNPAFGPPSPGYTIVSGLLQGDTPATAISGTPVFTMTADPTSSVSGSPYSITLSGLTSTNYTIQFVDGQLTINKATPTVTVQTSGTPTTYGQSVTFAANLSAGATDGTVTFYDNGVAIPDCPAVTLTGTATATCTTSNLAFSMSGHPITAVYSGGTN